MKKLVLAALLTAAMLESICADTGKNYQKIFPIDSDVYQAITSLYISQGLALPSTTGPWSTDELLKMLDKISTSKLSGGTQAAYDYAHTELTRELKPTQFMLNVNLEGYYHANTADFVQESQWVRGFGERKPLIDIVLETAPGRNFYGYSSLSVRNNEYNGWSSSKGATSTLFGQYPFTTNVWMVPPSVLSDLDFNFPFRAVGAFGGDGWSAEFGREQLSWGPGESGNFVIGDQLLYHNMGRITAYSKNFKYTLLTSFFPYPGNYYPIVDPTTGAFLHTGSSQADVVSGIKMFLAHRLEWNMFKSKVGFALTEGIMYQSADNKLDLIILSPAAIFHNYYIRSNANSILSGEITYTPIPYLNLYGQLVVDEFTMPGEPQPGEPGALPAAGGYMVGIKARYPSKSGMFSGSFEWALTDPYLYLRYGINSTQAQGDPGLNFVVALRTFSNAIGITYSEDFLGYKYGGDAIVYNGTIGYKRFGTWYASANFFYMIHGTHDKWTLWTDVSNASFSVSTPTTHHDTGNNGDINANLRNSVTKTVIVGIKGGYTVFKNLDLYAEGDFIYIQNPGNISTNPPLSDFQLTAGISYSL